MGIDSGYQTVTPIQFANIIWAIQQKAVRAQSARIYFGCFVLIASRLAAARVRRKRGKKSLDFNRYRIEELVQVTGLKTASVKRALRELSAAGLLTWSEREAIIKSVSLSGAEEFATRLACRRSPKRPIPVPRAVLRRFATAKRASVVYVMIAYLLRGLSISRKSADIGNRGTVKASWITAHLGVSLRSVRYVRQRLYAEGWISRDTKSFQRKLNRDGAYFAISLNWSAAATPARIRVRRTFAPRSPKIAAPFAPPREDMKTSIEDKNQKTPILESSGVYERGHSVAKSAPTIRSIVRADLLRFDRLYELYRQAAKARWLAHSEANLLNFVAAAIRAREAEGDSVRIFTSIVKRGLWKNITQAQEDRARLTVRRFHDHVSGC